MEARELMMNPSTTYTSQIQVPKTIQLGLTKSEAQLLMQCLTYALLVMKMQRELFRSELQFVCNLVEFLRKASFGPGKPPVSGFLSTNEYAQREDVSPKVILRLIQTGRLPACLMYDGHIQTYFIDADYIVVKHTEKGAPYYTIHRKELSHATTQFFVPSEGEGTGESTGKRQTKVVSQQRQEGAVADDLPSS